MHIPMAGQRLGCDTPIADAERGQAMAVSAMSPGRRRKSNREVIYPEHGQEKADTADTDDARCDDHQAPLEPQWHQVRRSGPTRYINPTSRLIKHSRTHAVLWRDPAAPDGATHYPSVTFLSPRVTTNPLVIPAKSEIPYRRVGGRFVSPEPE